jgi:hypothetical protein
MFTSVTEFFQVLENLTECRESTPEFYSMPEAFLTLIGENIPDLMFPPWAPTAFDFVNFNRRVLEAPEVADHLCEWLDLIFGTCQAAEDRLNLFMRELYADVWDKNPNEEPAVIETMLSNLGSIPTVIFQERVPARRVVIARKYSHFKAALDVEGIREVVIGSRPRVRFCFFIKTQSGDIAQFRMISDSEKPKIARRYELGLTENSRMILHHGRLHVVDFATGRLSCFSEEADPVHKIIEMPDRYDRRWQRAGPTSLQLFALDRHSQVFLFDFEAKTPIAKVAQFSCLIRCFAISEEFDRWLCCTEDGFYEVYSLHNSRFVNCHSLGRFVGTHILITEGLGTVLVKTRHHLWLFTVNGFPIKRVECPVDITQWISWCDQCGVDQVACVDQQARVFAFDAYVPESIRLIGVVDGRVLGFSFEPKVQAVVLVTVCSSVFVFPVNL